jgi:hypothetical protein
MVRFISSLTADRIVAYETPTELFLRRRRRWARSPAQSRERQVRVRPRDLIRQSEFDQAGWLWRGRAQRAVGDASDESYRVGLVAS